MCLLFKLLEKPASKKSGLATLTGIETSSRFSRVFVKSVSNPRLYWRFFALHVFVPHAIPETERRYFVRNCQEKHTTLNKPDRAQVAERGPDSFHVPIGQGHVCLARMPVRQRMLRVHPAARQP